VENGEEKGGLLRDKTTSSSGGDTSSFGAFSSFLHSSLVIGRSALALQVKEGKKGRKTWAPERPGTEGIPREKTGNKH